MTQGEEHSRRLDNLEEREAARRYIGDESVREAIFEDREILKQIDDFLEANGGHLESFVEQQAEMRRHTSAISRAVELFGPEGWAVPKLIPSRIFEKATEIYDQSHDLKMAELELVSQLRSGNVLEKSFYALGFIGAHNPEKWEVSRQRHRLALKAFKHHKKGAYEASIPIILSQIDGIFRDYGVKDLDFFVSSHRKRIQEFLDAETALGWKKMVLPLRRVFGRPAQASSAKGVISRHAIIHGRELAYDTEMNSTKCFVLLSAVVEWANIRAKVLEAKYATTQEARYAGTGEVDELGRQLDRREWEEIRDTLHSIERANYWHLSRTGEYYPNIQLVQHAPEFRPCIDLARINYTYNPYHGEAWFWVQTPSGFHIGLAQHKGKSSMWAWFYSNPPSDGPSGCGNWRHYLDDELPIELS